MEKVRGKRRGKERQRKMGTNIQGHKNQQPRWTYIADTKVFHRINLILSKQRACASIFLVKKKKKQEKTNKKHTVIEIRFLADGGEGHLVLRLLSSFSSLLSSFLLFFFFLSFFYLICNESRNIYSSRSVREAARSRRARAIEMRFLADGGERHLVLRLLCEQRANRGFWEKGWDLQYLHIQ